LKKRYIIIVNTIIYTFLVTITIPVLLEYLSFEGRDRSANTIKSVLSSRVTSMESNVVLHMVIKNNHIRNDDISYRARDLIRSAAEDGSLMALVVYEKIVYLDSVNLIRKFYGVGAGTTEMVDKATRQCMDIVFKSFSNNVSGNTYEAIITQNAILNGGILFAPEYLKDKVKIATSGYDCSSFVESRRAFIFKNSVSKYIPLSATWIMWHIKLSGVDIDGIVWRAMKIIYPSTIAELA